jgi:TolB-like protein/cytochrome c-type biogenesis protein CcmH/NrfG
LVLPELVRDTAPVPDRSVDQSIPQEPLPAARSRRRLLLGIAALLALTTGGAFWLSHRAATPPVAASPVPALALPDQSVAVLPFESLSTEPNNEFLALGIAETVLHRLASLHDLTVIARTSSFVFKNRSDDARQIGRALNARYLVEGSVQRAGERLRVQTQLIDAVSGKQMWSLAFDRPLADIFALQDEISSRVADQLSVSLAPDNRPANGVNTSHVDAYLSYLQGRALVSTGKIADTALAIQTFARAVQIDPQFAAAYAQESRAITRLSGLQERDDPEGLKRAIALNDRALTLDPRLGEAWVQRASLRLVASGEKDAADAEKAFRRGLDLAPNYGEGFEEYANFLWDQNRQDDALIMAERARQVDPLTPRHHYLKAILLVSMGRDSPEVDALYLQALKLDPTYHPALIRLGQRYSRRGEFARGLMLQERALAVEPASAWVRGATAAPYLSIGDFAAAEDVLSAELGLGTGMKICVLMQKEDHLAAVRLAYDLFDVGHLDTLTMAELCASTEVLRDALATRHYDRALHVMESQYAIHPGNLEGGAQTAFIWGVPFAQLLRIKGDTVRADGLAQSILASTDQDPNDPSFLLARAGALALLGDYDQALDALDNSVHRGARPLWWVIDRDSIFDPLRQHDRYKALVATMAETVRNQSELVAKMREKHELPQRPANVAVAN